MSRLAPRTRPARAVALLPLAPVLVALLVPLAAAGDLGWAEEDVIADGRYNNAARLSFHELAGYVGLAYKAQIGTDSNTRQIAAGSRTGDPPAWPVADITANVSSKEYPDIAVSADSVAHVVWREHLGGGDWQIFYATDRAGSWSTPRQLTFDATLKGAPVIAARDSTGMVHIAYPLLEDGTTNDEIWYLRYDSLADSSDFLQITDDNVSDTDPVIEVTDLGGFVSLAWVTGSITGGIRCVEGTLAEGFTEIPTGVAAGAAQPDIGLDFDSSQHIVYRHTVTSSVRVIRYIERQGTGFSAPVDVSPTDAFYTQPSIAIRYNAHPHVVYVSNTAGHEGFYLVPSNPDFEAPIPLMTDPDVTYNETDIEPLLIAVGLPGARSAGEAVAVVSTGYVDGGLVQADLHLFSGQIHATSAPEVPEGAPAFELAARPSPFSAGTVVSFALPRPASRVRLDAYDVTGRRVAGLLDRPLPAGPQRVSWNPRRLPAGVYWLRLDVDGRATSRTVHRLR
jgi:hypothetical protein